ncbi:hypothetical protein LYNGBM3L_60070 [Moorena producens 3L]|uniref:Uncharacterized protein n=1 Tax=Moorena producens 3L TaxID=489825 RepID=F4Y039_9CYAN|nr:hypothetical protein LYNGBM3L_60070 [Moorena producens 3L]
MRVALKLNAYYFKTIIVPHELHYWFAICKAFDDRVAPLNLVKKFFSKARLKE